MAWSEEVQTHRTQVERRRDRLRNQGVSVDECNRTDFLPVAVAIAVISSLYIWLDGRHKLRKGGFLRRVPLVSRLFGGPRKPHDARVAAREAAERRNRAFQARRQDQADSSGRSSTQSRSGSQKQSSSRRRQKGHRR